MLLEVITQPAWVMHLKCAAQMTGKWVIEQKVVSRARKHMKESGTHQNCSTASALGSMPAFWGSCIPVDVAYRRCDTFSDAADQA